MTMEQLTTGQIDQQAEQLRQLTTAELSLLLLVITHCLQERGVIYSLPSRVNCQKDDQADDLDQEFDEIDTELGRAKVQRWLIVILNIVLSILIELAF